MSEVQPEQPAPEQTDNEQPQKKRGAKRDYWSAAVLILGVGSLLALLIGGLGARAGILDLRLGLGLMPVAILAAIIALLLAIVDIMRSRKRERGVAWRGVLIGAVCAIIPLAYLLPWLAMGIGKPSLHDISTDLADPPDFVAFDLREDNWDNIPGADDSDYAGLNPRQRWARIHQEAYPEIRSVRVDQPVATVIAKAERLAESRGWDVELVQPRRGRMEATDTVSIFGFKDDVVLIARPVDGGQASVIDMRSVSRVGVGDVGVNADRIQSFLSDLSGTTTTGSN